MTVSRDVKYSVARSYSDLLFVGVLAFWFNVTRLVLRFYSAFLRKGLLIFSLGSQINSTSNKHNSRCMLKLHWLFYVNIADGMWMPIVVKLHLSCWAYFVYTGKLDSGTRGKLTSTNVQTVCTTSSCPVMETFKFSYAFCFLPAWFRDQITYAKILKAICKSRIYVSLGELPVLQTAMFSRDCKFRC
jgi:hypothetical protein